MEKKTIGKQAGNQRAMIKKQTIGLIAALLLLLSVFLISLIYNQWPLWTGTEIVLATRPIDPFDPFMGQYLMISYAISTINNTEVFEAGDVVYVSLAKSSSGVWDFADATSTKPESSIFIKGRVVSSYSTVARVEYGIENYYFERNAKIPTLNITVEVKIANSGRAKIVQLLQNGEPLNIDYEDFDIKS